MDMGRMQGSNDITRGPGPSLPLEHTFRCLRSQGQAGYQGVTWCTVKNLSPTLGLQAGMSDRSLLALLRGHS